MLDIFDRQLDAVPARRSGLDCGLRWLQGMAAVHGPSRRRRFGNLELDVFRNAGDAVRNRRSTRLPFANIDH